MQSTTERQMTISPTPLAKLPTGSTVITLDGDLSIAAAPALRERLIGMLRAGTRLMIVDLSRVQSCDSAGLAVLIGTQRRAKERGTLVRLVAPSPPVAKLLRSTGLERWLTIYPDLPGALAQGRDQPARAVALPSAR
jgi:anti-anti-sigma factor